MINPKFICFIGIDGSGKTTQAQSLVTFLKKNGIKSKYVWNRFEPRIMKIFTLIVRFFVSNFRKSDKNKKNITKKKLLNKSSFFSTTYRYILFFDYAIQIFCKIQIPLLFNERIICDRYIYDTAADLAVDLGYSTVNIHKLLNRIFYLVPAPDLIFLIDIPEKIAFKRKDDIPSLKYLEERREIYLKMAEDMDIVIIDGNRTIIELQHEIQRKIILQEQ